MKFLSLSLFLFFLMIASGCTSAIKSAGTSGSISTVKVYLDEGADINATDRDGGSLLFYACTSGDVDLAEYLLDNGANVDVGATRGNTPFVSASILKKYPAMKLLLERGADPNHETQFGTAFTFAAHFGHSETVKFLLGIDDIDVNVKGFRRMTPLEGADKHRFFDIVRMILESGKYIDDEGNPINIHLAVKYLSINLLEKFLESGIDPNLRDEDNKTPLDVLESKDSLDFFMKDDEKKLYDEVARMLLENGADPYMTNSSNVPIIYNAIKADNTPFLLALIKAGLDLNEPHDGQTLLHVIAERDDILRAKMTAKMFVKYGADPTISNINGQTPDDIFAEKDRIAAEKERKKEQRRQEELRRKREQNNQLFNQLFAASAGVAMGSAIKDAGGSADRVVDSGMAVYKDISSGTTSNMQSLTEQYRQENSLIEARSQQRLQEATERADMAAAKQAAEIETRKSAYNDCIGTGGRWTGDACVAVDGTIKKVDYAKVVSTVQPAQVAAASNKLQPNYNQQEMDGERFNSSSLFSSGNKNVFTATVKGTVYTVEKNPSKYVGMYESTAARCDWKYRLTEGGRGWLHIQTTRKNGTYYYDDASKQDIVRWGRAIDPVSGQSLKKAQRSLSGGPSEAEIIIFEVEECPGGHGTCKDPGTYSVDGFEHNNYTMLGTAKKLN